MNLDYLFSLPYMRWHIIFTIIPSILLWIFFGKYFLNYKKTILLVAFFSFFFGLILDIVVSPILGIYSFHPTQNLGISLLGLPLEEYIFLLLVPQETALILLLIRRKILYG